MMTMGKKRLFQNAEPNIWKISWIHPNLLSLMYAGCADGSVLPPYVVYKALNMYNLWTIGGPKVNLVGMTSSVSVVGL